MSAHDSAVDHRIFVVRVGGEMLKNPLPDSGFRPPAEPPMHVLPVAEARRQVTPRTASAVTIENRLHENAVVRRRHPDRAWPAGQQVLEPLPLIVTKAEAMHWSAPES
jgi:hypothetical protein